MLQEYLSLVGDTIKLLQNDAAYFFASEEEITLFKTTLSIKKQTPIIPSQKILPKVIEEVRTKNNNTEIRPQLNCNIETVKNEEKPKNDSNVLFLQNIRNTVEKIAPNIISDDIPNDEEAILIAQRWKYINKTANISLITATKNTQEQILLKNLAKALNTIIMPASYVDPIPIEMEDIWKEFLSSENLKIILIDDLSLNSLPKLKKYFRQIPVTKENFFHNIPVFILPEVAKLLKNPLEKAILWQELTQMIKNVK